MVQDYKAIGALPKPGTLRVRNPRLHYPRLHTKLGPEGTKELWLLESPKLARRLATWTCGKLEIPELNYTRRCKLNQPWWQVKRLVLNLYRDTYARAAKAYQAQADAWASVQSRERKERRDV